MKALPTTTRLVLGGAGWNDEPTEGLGKILEAISWYPKNVDITVGIIPTAMDNFGASTELAGLKAELNKRNIKYYSLVEGDDVNAVPTIERAKQLVNTCQIWVFFGGNIAELLARLDEIRDEDGTSLADIFLEPMTDENRNYVLTVIGTSAGAGWIGKSIFTADVVEEDSSGRRIPRELAEHYWLTCRGLLPVRLVLHYNERMRKLDWTARAELVQKEAENNLRIGEVVIGIDSQAWFTINHPEGEVVIDASSRYARVERIEVVPRSPEHPKGLKIIDYNRGTVLTWSEFFLPTTAPVAA